MLTEKSVLITGGTGSLGHALVKEILNRWPSVRRLVVFSRDELKQHEMREAFPEDHFPSLRFFLGDVRDRQRLVRAFNRVDVVIHAAALKQVPAAEYNPMEFIRTNVIGAENVVEAGRERDSLGNKTKMKTPTPGRGPDHVKIRLKIRVKVMRKGKLKIPKRSEV